MLQQDLENIHVFATCSYLICLGGLKAETLSVDHTDVFVSTMVEFQPFLFSYNRNDLLRISTVILHLKVFAVEAKTHDMRIYLP